MVKEQLIADDFAKETYKMLLEVETLKEGGE
jgi:hypothetical protein